MMHRNIHEIIADNPKIVEELGERLYCKITEVVVPEWEEAFKQLTRQDCIDYIDWKQSFYDDVLSGKKAFVYGAGICSETRMGRVSKSGLVFTGRR